jgi:hypothetical protein
MTGEGGGNGEIPLCVRNDGREAAVRRGSLGIRRKLRRWRGSRRRVRESPRPVRKTIFDVQPNGVLTVLHGFLVGISLGVAALKSGTGNEVAVGVAFNDDGKRQVPHRFIIGRAAVCSNVFWERS